MKLTQAQLVLGEIDDALADPIIYAFARTELENFKARIKGLMAESRQLDADLAAIVTETEKAGRAKLAQTIKRSMHGLLGEECTEVVGGGDANKSL